MKEFIDFIFKHSLMESLDSGEKFTQELKESNSERDVIVGRFLVNEKVFNYLFEYNKDNKGSTFQFKQLKDGEFKFGSLKNLTPKESLSVFSTIKDILQEMFNKYNIEYLYAQAAYDKLIKTYMKISGNYLKNYEFFSSGIDILIKRKTSEVDISNLKNFKNKFKRGLE